MNDKTIPLAELRNIRLSKALALRSKGINPYTAVSRRTHMTKHLVDGFEQVAGTNVCVAGRLVSFRKQGALSFGHVQDQSGRIQLYLRRDTMESTSAAVGTLGYEDLGLLDVGDFVEAEGELTKTQRGEISILARRLRILTKSLRPLPDKWGGLKDREAVLRRRYLDLTLQPERKASFEALARMLLSIRGFLAGRGFLEFNTPVIQPQYGGGTARPFVTHVDALDCEMYLSISHELYLKRLIAGGFEKVFTIGRYFRNEGIDRTHHPEFSMIETMAAYENYEYSMQLVEDLFRHVAESVFEKSRYTVQSNVIDFGPSWTRVSMVEAIRRYTGKDFSRPLSLGDANAQLAALGLDEAQPTVGHVIARIFDEVVSSKLIQPTLVYGHPVEISPLAKPMEDDPRFAERFEIFIAGIECGDNWSEQNDPVHLLERWRSQRDDAPDDRHPLDYDFLEALEYGIPPTTGIGPGIERMAMIFTEQDNIDDVIFFPMMKPVLSETNRALYSVPRRTPTPRPANSPISLSVKDFEDLLESAVIRPAGKLTIRPFLTVWRHPTNEAMWRASGCVDIEGFFDDRLVRVAGYTVKSEPFLLSTDEARRFRDVLDLSLIATIRQHFPTIPIETEAVSLVSPPVARTN